MISTFKKIVRNPAIFYTTSRYFTYILQFISSLIIAIYLGPYYLGIWGFINLIINYITQFNLGISHSVNVIVSINKKNDSYAQKISSNGLTMVLLLCLFIIVLLLINKYSNSELGSKYNFNKYVVPITLIAVLTHVNAYMSNIFRIYGQIYAIALYQSLYPILLILVLPFFRGEKLLLAMLIVNIVALTFSLFIFYIKYPLKVSLAFNWQIIKRIQNKGWYLFLYSASFLFILLTTKSFISGYYQVEEFGFFTFAYTLANAVLLFLNSMSFLIFPKMLNRFATSSDKDIEKILTSIRTVYISVSHFIVHLIILLFPVFIYFFPQYQSSLNVFRFIALTIALHTNAFGYQGLLMARNNEKKLSIMALSALLLNIILCYFLVCIIGVPYYLVIIATMITYFVYVISIGSLGRKSINKSGSFTKTLLDIFPIRMMIPYIASLMFAYINSNNLLFFIPVIIYYLLNYKEIEQIKKIALKLINNPNLINI